MATFHQLTTSNGPTIERSDRNAVHEILDNYEFLGNHSPLYIELSDPHEEGGEGAGGTERLTLNIHGQAPFHPHPPRSELDHPDDIHHEPRQREFLERLAPYLTDVLVVQTIGREKTRYPFSAHEWVATPDGRVHHTTFTHGTLPDPDPTDAKSTNGEPA